MLIQMIESPQIQSPIIDMIPLPVVQKQLAGIATTEAIRWALRKQVVKPTKIGCYTLFTQDQVKTLKEHFATRGRK